MSTRSECNIFRSPWITSCPSLSSGGLASEVTSSLSEQILGNSNSNEIFSLFQNPWRFGEISNNESCSKSCLISPKNFLYFSNFPSYFSPEPKTELSIREKLEKDIPVGSDCQCLCRLTLASHWLYGGGAALSLERKSDDAVALFEALLSSLPRPLAKAATRSPFASIVGILLLGAASPG
jgi:hypothetical protein